MYCIQNLVRYPVDLEKAPVAPLRLSEAVEAEAVLPFGKRGAQQLAVASMASASARERTGLLAHQQAFTQTSKDCFLLLRWYSQWPLPLTARPPG